VGQCLHPEKVLSQSLTWEIDQKRANQGCRKGCHDMSRTSDFITFRKPLRLTSCVENTRYPVSASPLTSTVAFPELNKTGPTPAVGLKSGSYSGTGYHKQLKTSSLHQRVVEEGVFCIRARLKLVVVCEMYPIWLVCLNALSCSELIIMGFATQTNLVAILRNKVSLHSSWRRYYMIYPKHV
jgi:hypothetical protein